MKQKLTRALIDEIRKEMPILSEDENKCVIGGGSLYIIGDHGTITYSGSTPSDKTMIAVGSIEGGNVFYVSGDVSFCSTDNGYRISGSGASKELFEFLANNTDVEWAMYEDSTSGYAFIDTSNQYRSVTVGNYSGYDTFYHNHEYNHVPSDTDLDFSSEGYYDNYYIYHEYSNSYVPF